VTIPTYVGVATNQGSTSLTVVSIATIDAGAPPTTGDLLLAHVVRNGSVTTQDCHFAAPAGWHRLGASQNNLVSAFFWRIREAGDSNSLSFSRPASGSNIIAVHCIRGVDQTRPICRHSIQRTNSDTWSWLAETTPVDDCLALALAGGVRNGNGISPASGWTERVDLAQSTDLCMYAQTQGFASSGTSTGNPSVALSGAGLVDLTQHMLLIQPAQTVTPKDVRVATGTLTSPTSTGNQDITGLGFDCKALIIYGMRQNADATTPDVEYLHGVGADDGVTTAFQRGVGISHLNGSGSAQGWVNANIVAVYFASGLSISLRATFSRITDGFRLNWSVVQASGYDFNYIAFGGADLQAVCGIQDGSASPMTALPWRPDLVHIVGQNNNADAPYIRSGSGNGQMSVGWLDPRDGACWNLAQDLSSSVPIRDKLVLRANTLGRVDL
jgi:hypothetical protein